MKKSKFILTFVLFATFFLTFTPHIYAQEDIQIGKSRNEIQRYNGAFYDYSDRDAINIKVMVWGYLKISRTIYNSFHKQCK